MSAVLRRGRLVWRPLRHRISRYAAHTPDLHRLLQQLPLPLQAAPVGSLHCPPQQTLPPVQTVPQAPQLVVVFRAVHTPLQHPCPLEHLLPQVPQLFASMVTLTHLPLQRVCGGVHTVWHAPSTQLCPAPHVVPQAPQFVTVLRSVQTPLQQPCPDPQVETHLPVAASQRSQLVALHAVARQVFPQTRVFGQQTPLIQVDCPATHVETHVPVAALQTSHAVGLQAVTRQVLPQTLVFGQHAPARQVSCAVQEETHRPLAASQTWHCSGSHAVARHVLPQTLVFGQHTPAMQVSLAPQETPQRPQFCSSSRRFLQTPEQHASPAAVLQASAHSPQLLLSF